MFFESFPKKVNNTKESIVAIGFSPAQDQVTISGSGFCVSSDGKILTAAHIYNQTPLDFQKKLMAMVMVSRDINGLENYKWFPINFLRKNDQEDVALFELKDYANTMIKPLNLGNSDSIEVGQDVYFIGFPYAAQFMNQRMGITLCVNKGIVSNIKQDGIDSLHPRNLIIVDAISNPGNSGCPLLDSKSNKVIGIMSIAFSKKSEISKYSDLDIRETMHIAGAKTINQAKNLIDPNTSE